MSRVIVLGGRIAGRLSGMQFARQGHDVTVREWESRVAVAPPAEAPTTPRAGAPHAVQGHALLARAVLRPAGSVGAVGSAAMTAMTVAAATCEAGNPWYTMEPRSVKRTGNESEG